MDFTFLINPFLQKREEVEKNRKIVGLKTIKNVLINLDCLRKSMIYLLGQF